MTEAAHPFVHGCEHPGCTEWGAFGFGVCLLKDVPGHWFCRAHRADGAVADTRPGATAAPPTPSPRAIEKQGRLL